MFGFVWLSLRIQMCQMSLQQEPTQCIGLLWLSFAAVTGLCLCALDSENIRLYSGQQLPQ